MPSTTSDIDVHQRAADLLREHRRQIHTQVDRLMAGLLAVEWLAAVVIGFTVLGKTWDGAVSRTHPHAWAALFLGFAIVSLPIWFAFARPGTVLSRHVIAAAQMLMSALLIHVGGGRIEMHFHVFGSLAFLAFYRDWRVLITGTIVVATDHLARGLYAPLSVYGVANASLWRTVEHAGWVVFEDIFLIASCVRATREMTGIALNQALLERSHREVEIKVEERTRELKDAQDELLKAARTAGMAEIATSVLHNVGNVLNSVNVSATVVADKIKQSEVPTLAQVSDLIAENKPNLGTFLSTDERGQAIPDFIRDLSQCLIQEQDFISTEVAQMSKGIDHIKQIIASQQSMAKRTNLQALVAPAKLIETAITMQSATRSTDLTIERRLASDLPAAALLDEHKVLQILINLLSNARQAVAARPAGTRAVSIIVSTQRDDASAPLIRFAVTDNGMGIAKENLTRIFAHGFTTKKEGHGFGLHSAANAAREMGGSLTVESPGVSLGATFTLDLPLRTEVDADVQQKGLVACH